jgi:hypothetical protein
MAVLVAEEAVGCKEARCVKPRASGLHVPERKEPAKDRLERRSMPKGTRTQHSAVFKRGSSPWLSASPPGSRASEAFRSRFFFRGR